MRRVLSIALVLLLLMRGLLGDAMAMGATPMQHAAAITQSTPSAGHGDHGTHDGMRHAAASTAPCCDVQDDIHAAHAAGCGACGICHAAPALAPWLSTPAAGPHQAPLPLHGAAFASAPAAQAIKPPIA